jgi:hypothetical protein
VQGPGFRIEGSGSRIQGPGLMVQGLGLRVQGSGSGVLGLGCDPGWDAMRDTTETCPRSAARCSAVYPSTDATSVSDPSERSRRTVSA